jgi:hypothetical protein
MKKHQAFEVRSRQEYPAESRRRLIRLVTRLRRMQWNFIHTMDAVGSILRDQELASRKAKFPGTAHLCGTMADEAGLMRAVVEPALEGMVGRLLGDCRQLGRHVEELDAERPAENRIHPVAVHALHERAVIKGSTSRPHVRSW